MSPFRLLVALIVVAAAFFATAIAPYAVEAATSQLVTIPATAGFNTVVLETGQMLGLDMTLPGAVSMGQKSGWIPLNGTVDFRGVYTAPTVIPTGALDVIEFWSSSPKVPNFVIRVTVVAKGSLKADAKSPLWDVLTPVPVTPNSKPATFILPCVSKNQPHSCVMPALAGTSVVYVCHRKGPFNALPKSAPNASVPFPVAANASYDVPGKTVETKTPMEWTSVAGSEKIDAARAVMIANTYGAYVPVQSGVGTVKVKGKNVTQPINNVTGRARDVYYQRLSYTDHYKASPDDKSWIYVKSTEELQEGTAREFEPQWLAVFTTAPPKGAPLWKPATSGDIVQDTGPWTVAPAAAAPTAK